VGSHLTILKDYERTYIKSVFGLVKNNVYISFFTQTHESQSGREARKILEEISSISDKIHLNLYDFDKDSEAVDKYKIDKLPATIIEGSKDFGIRYFGVPGGYLVSSLVEDVIQISKGESDLSVESRKKLEKITRPLHLMIFVTPTSPYSPALANIAHRLSIENDNISADVIDITAFPHLAMRYQVVDVPFTVVNNKIAIEGAPDENDFVNRILEAIRK